MFERVKARGRILYELNRIDNPNFLNLSRMVPEGTKFGEKVQRRTAQVIENRIAHGVFFDLEGADAFIKQIGLGKRLAFSLDVAKDLYDQRRNQTMTTSIAQWYLSRISGHGEPFEHAKELAESLYENTLMHPDSNDKNTNYTKYFVSDKKLLVLLPPVSSRRNR